MIAVLYNIRSIHNVGSIFRTADGAGIEKIYLCGITPSPVDALGRPDKKFIKVSLGAEKNILWEKTAFPIKLLKRLKKEGYKCFAIEQDPQSIAYNKTVLSGILAKKVVLIVGHERKGVPQSIRKEADAILEIPMYGEKESLNVSVAFGIVAYHFAGLNK